jgi:hypothetical protein
LAQTRGAAGIAPIELPAGTRLVSLELELEADDFPAYRVALKEPGVNRILWRSESLKAHRKGENKALSIAVPADLLEPRNYVLELTGAPASGGSEFVSSYSFRPIRK